MLKSSKSLTGRPWRVVCAAVLLTSTAATMAATTATTAPGEAAPASATTAKEAALRRSWDGALKSKDLETLAILVANGADPAWTGKSGRTALMYAAEGGDLELVDALLAAGAPTSAGPPSSSPRPKATPKSPCCSSTGAPMQMPGTRTAGRR
jgi:hypothetical protein